MRAVLRFLAGAEPHGQITVERGQVLTIGRSSSADRKVRDGHLSRVHFALDFTGDICVATDMKSRNGIFVNGTKVERAPLRAGDRLQAGEQVFEVQYKEAIEDSLADLEETRSLLDRSNKCEHCGRPISLATFADGEVKERGGRYLCPDCATILDVGRDDFMGFKVLEKLGAGSAGLVFRAKQLFLGRIVALKVLRRREDLTEKQVVRFLREAATISRLDHPNIVKVYDANEFEKGYFIVMEFFPGRDLLGLVEAHGPASPPVAVSIGIQMCRALAYAAKEGIVHRDIKPANILYRAEDGLAKLSDFGLAKRLGRTSWTGITRDGEGLGTPCYMPPEQVKDARNADPRADIYSLGASLYHILTGRYPVIATSYQDFLAQILERDPPRIEELNAAVPGPLCEIVRQATRKDPAERFQTAVAMGEALEKVRVACRYPPPPKGTEDESAT